MVRGEADVSESSAAALIGLAVYFGLRLVDYLLPKGRHWQWIERWSRPDKDPLPPLPPTKDED